MLVGHGFPCLYITDRPPAQFPRRTKPESAVDILNLTSYVYVHTLYIYLILGEVYI
jgi:hypothetical protein